MGRDGARPGRPRRRDRRARRLRGGPARARGRASAEPAELVARHLRPQPRLESGARWRAAGATAMIDLSDGLATDARHVADRSGVALRVRLDDVPRAAGRERRSEAVTGGDDYELLVTVPPERRAAAEAAAPLTWIGEVVSR